MAEDRIVAVGLLTQREVEMLGHGFSRLWPIDETPCFPELIRAIDDADREFRRSGGKQPEKINNPKPHPVPGGGRY